MTGIYRFAEMNIRITSVCTQVHAYCAAYRVDGPPALEVVTTQADIDFERERSAREDRAEGIPIRRFPDAYLETLAVYRRIAEQMPYRDTVLFHGSCVAVDGGGLPLYCQKRHRQKHPHPPLEGAARRQGSWRFALLCAI